MKFIFFVLETIFYSLAAFDRKMYVYVIHRRKKDGGCTFYHNALRT